MRDNVRDALVRCDRATLVFDRYKLGSNAVAIARAARGARITPLFAVKSFPQAANCVEVLAGFDVGSAAELDLVVALGMNNKLISIADPSGLAIARAPSSRRVVVAADSVEQVRAAPPQVDIAIRISASITGRDPAVGAILDGTGHRRSRFGVARIDEVRALHEAADQRRSVDRAAGARRVGLHIHHGPVTATSPDRFIASARAAIELTRSAGLEPEFIDLGGAWHGIGLANIATAFATIRAAIDEICTARSEPIEILVEPGRLLVEDAGFAVAPTTSVRDLGDGRLLVTSGLSRICHLRWSQVELVAKAPHPGAGVKAIVVGPTCYEEDVVGEWIVEPAEIAKRVVLRNVSGYAAAWNTSFGGVPPADLVFVD